MVERTAGEPLESAAQLRAILGLSRRLASIDEIGELQFRMKKLGIARPALR